ncbi:MAG: anhydro-N-acetylmuramic acid kinase [Pseudomonadota bacterium]
MAAGLYIGLMSGTSVDSIDAALLSVDSDQFELIGTATTAYDSALRTALLTLKTTPSTSLSQLIELDHRVACAFAEAANQLLRNSLVTAKQITAIGSHGQTIFHLPDSANAGTMQIGDPSLIAALTGIDVIADFRRADMAAGGQGAPLAPAFHRFALGTDGQVVLNLGGIANITVLQADTIGFDTGPANSILDECAQRNLQQPFDDNGNWARTGQVNQALLRALLQDSYFAKPPPKSTGTDYFNLDWVLRHTGAISVAAEDLQRTLVELTAISVADGIRLYGTGAPVYVCGGGLKNTLLLEQIRHHLNDVPVNALDDAGINADACECCTFAWLAYRFRSGLPGNLPSVTGASRAVLLGALYPASQAPVSE